MKYNTFFILLMLSANLLFAGPRYKRSATGDTARHITLDTVEVKGHEGPSPYQASATWLWEITNTRVAISFNWKEKTADAREWIKMQPYCYPADSILLDAKSMKIDSIGLVGKAGITTLKYTYKENSLVVLLDKPYKSSDSIQLYLKYTAMPYASHTGGSAAITDDRGLYFINTDYQIPNKPAQIWTQGETESNSHWMITIDKPNTRFTTQLEITVPDSFTTLSNGALVKQLKGSKGLRTDIWKMDMPIQAYAVMMAIGKFSIVKEKWKNKEVNYYVEPQYAPFAKLMFNHTPEMIDYFSQRTGVPYPWNKYSQVVVRDYVSGAMENTSATLCGEFLNQTAREIADRNSEDVVSHELFHQWFGDYVTCESWSNITVNESFANYGEQLWRAHKYGKASGDELAWNDLQGYVYSSMMHDPQLVRFNYDSREEVFDAISYNKGGAILHYLNTLIGDAAFDKAMKIYLTKNALHSAEAHNWRMAVEEATGQDWNWFFNEWYYHGGHPALRVNYMYNDSIGKLIVAVNQVQSDSEFNFRLPLKAAVIYGDDKTIADWVITKRKDTFTYDYKNGVKPIIIPDCQHILPGEIKENKKPSQWYEQFTHSTDYVSKRLAVSGASKQIGDSLSQVIITLGLNDEMKSIRIAALSVLGNVQSEKYKRRWTPRVTEMAKSDSVVNVRADAIELLSSWKVSAAKPLLLSSIYDSSYFVAGNALEGLGKLDKDTAYIIARSLAPTHPRSSLATAVWTAIGAKGADEDINIFREYAPNMLGNRNGAFTIGISSYMKHVKSDASFTAAAEILTSLITDESSRTTRAMYAGMLFQTASEYKGDLKSDDKEEAATAQKRINILKPFMQKITDTETDTEAQDGYKKKMKNISEQE